MQNFFHHVVLGGYEKTHQQPHADLYRQGLKLNPPRGFWTFDPLYFKFLYNKGLDYRIYPYYVIRIIIHNLSKFWKKKNADVADHRNYRCT